MCRCMRRIFTKCVTTGNKTITLEDPAHRTSWNVNLFHYIRAIFLRYFIIFFVFSENGGVGNYLQTYTASFPRRDEFPESQSLGNSYTILLYRSIKNVISCLFDVIIPSRSVMKLSNIVLRLASSFVRHLSFTFLHLLLPPTPQKSYSRSLV